MLTGEERDNILLELRDRMTGLEGRMDRLETGQGELLIYVKEIAKRLLSPAEITEVETGIAIALSVVQGRD